MLKNQHPETARPNGNPAQSALIVGVFAVVTLVLDLLSKQWAWVALKPPHGHARMIWSPTLEFSFAFNTGGAFGMLRDAELGWPVFAGLAALTLVYVFTLTVRSPGGGPLRFVALGVIVGGALGNLHDRVLRVNARGEHGVVDFIKINYPWGGSWPNFNVADIALAVGVGLLMLALLREGGAPEQPAGAE